MFLGHLPELNLGLRSEPPEPTRSILKGHWATLTYFVKFGITVWNFTGTEKWEGNGIFPPQVTSTLELSRITPVQLFEIVPRGRAGDFVN